MDTVQNNTSVREIRKARLIAALLAELDASGAIILAECQSTGKIFHRPITCSFKIPFEESAVTFRSPDSELDDSNVLKCVCCYAGQRILFELKRKFDESWQLPEIMSLVNLRSDDRIAFADKMYTAELISERGAVYGYASDINSDYIAINVDAAHRFKEGDSVKVVVRMVNTNCDVFYNLCKVSQIKQLADDVSRFILSFVKKSVSASNSRLHERIPVESASLKLTSSVFTETGEDLSVSIVNVSYGGVTVRIRNKAASSQMVTGHIFKSNELEISMLAVWVGEDIMGLRPLLFEPRALSAWYRYVDQVAPPKGRKTSVTRRELTEILTHSGLLKGARRQPFGKQLDGHIISNSRFESPLLVQRYYVANSENQLELHLSAKRISEHSWLLGEGSALSANPGDYFAMLDLCLVRLGRLARQSEFMCRYLTAIWHDSVKSSVTWFSELAMSPQSCLFDAFQLSVAAVSKTSLSTSALECHHLHEFPAEKRRLIGDKFNPVLFEAIAGNSGRHPILNSELGKLGPLHSSMTRVVDLSGGKYVIAHRMVTHNVWSTTGVINSVFVVVPESIEPAELKLALDQLVRDEISYGTDDFALLFCGSSGICERHSSVLPSPRRFSFIVHDLLLNQQVQFKDVG